MASRFSVVAIIAAHNEDDIVGQVVADLVAQGVSVYFLDDSSTDRTIAEIEPLVGRGVIEVENLRETFGDDASDTFEWERILRRKAQIASQLEADWFIHHDADEFRESPWPRLSLSEAIQEVDAAGFNAIDFALFNFWPVDDCFRRGDDVRQAFRYYAPAQRYDRVQIRCWKKAQAVELASSGGHEAKFVGRRVFPLPFILRHYPIRGQAHGERKISRERRLRFLGSERARGWHIQYDDFCEGASIIRDPATLIAYDPVRARLDLMLHGDLERAEKTLQSAHAEAAAIAGSLDDQTKKLGEVVRAAEARTREAEDLRRDLDARAIELESLQQGLAERSRQIEDLYQSMSWRVTSPLRAIYRVVTGERPVPDRASTTPSSRLNWGDLARNSPVSDVWGLDRGLPIDRHYIERFLAHHRGDIRGRVLEVEDSHYARTFGGSDVREIDVLDIDAGNPHATIVADLADVHQLPAKRYECFILTQTLHIIYDIRSAVRHAGQLLAPGGVLLCTIPAASRVNYENGGLESGDFWRLTRAAVTRLFTEVFGAEHVSVATFGNVRVCAAFLYGLATEDLDASVLAYDDPWFPLIHCIRATKSMSSSE